MSSQRENKDIISRLFSYDIRTDRNGNKTKIWKGKSVFTKHFWRYSEYIWHDTIGFRWNKYVKCKLRGHANVQDVSDPCIGDKEPKYYCFDCNTELETFRQWHKRLLKEKKTEEET